MVIDHFGIDSLKKSHKYNSGILTHSTFSLDINKKIVAIVFIYCAKDTT